MPQSQIKFFPIILEKLILFLKALDLIEFGAEPPALNFLIKK
jgi:hypothetical protein